MRFFDSTFDDYISLKFALDSSAQFHCLTTLEVEVGRRIERVKWNLWTLIFIVKTSSAPTTPLAERAAGKPNARTFWHALTLNACADSVCIRYVSSVVIQWRSHNFFLGGGGVNPPPLLSPWLRQCCNNALKGERWSLTDKVITTITCVH